MWADRYLKLTLKLKFRYNVKFVLVVVETPKISATLCMAILLGNWLIPLPKLCGECRIISCKFRTHTVNGSYNEMPRVASGPRAVG
jgi:hypothetical protein